MHGLRVHIVAIYIVLLILNLILWVVAAFLIEHKLLQAYDSRRKLYKKSPWRLVFASAVMAVFVFASNTVLFAYGA